MERKKMVNITLPFSAVTNINSWRVKSALSNVVSLVWKRAGLGWAQTKLLYCTKSPPKKRDSKAVYSIASYELLCSSQHPTRPFHNFRASISGNRRVLSSSGTSYGVFGSSIVVKRVGRGGFFLQGRQLCYFFEAAPPSVEDKFYM